MQEIIICNRMKRSRVGHQENKSHVIIAMPKSYGGGNIAQESTFDETAMLTNLSPLIVSMRLFGLFFLKDKENDVSNSNCGRWSLPKFNSPSHVYASVVLMVMWLNTIRYATVFFPNDKPASDLILKASWLTWTLMCTLAQTSFYRACGTGRMLKLLQSLYMKLDPDVHNRFRIKAILYAIVAWIFMAINVVFLGYVHFSSNENAMDVTLAPIRALVFPEGNIIPLMRSLYMVVHFYVTGAATLPMTLNLFIATIFSHQFTICNRKFREFIDNSDSDFEDLRRQHQKLSRLVSKADKFICFSNAAYISGLIFLVITNIYSLIWNPVLKIYPIILALTIFWLLWTSSGLFVVSFGAIIVNNAAHKINERIHDIDMTKLSAEMIGQINAFLNRLTGEPIGFTVMRIFVIDRNTILTIVGLLITYFLLIVQLVPPSSELKTYNLTTAVPTTNGYDIQSSGL